MPFNSEHLIQLLLLCEDNFIAKQYDIFPSWKSPCSQLPFQINLDMEIKQPFGKKC